MRQKTCFSVVEMRSENLFFVSENEGSDLGIPWPDGPPSSDCPVGWHTDDAPRRRRVRALAPAMLLARPDVPPEDIVLGRRHVRIPSIWTVWASLWVSVVFGMLKDLV